MCLKVSVSTRCLVVVIVQVCTTSSHPDPDGYAPSSDPLSPSSPPVETGRRGNSQKGNSYTLKIGSQLLTQSGRGHGFNQRLALTPGVVREPLRLENFLALQEAVGIGSKPLDEGFARGQLIQTSPQLGEGGTLPGTPGWREPKDLIGPGEQAVHMHKPRLGAYFGRRQTGENRVREFARDATTGCQKSSQCGVILVGALEHSRYGVRDIVDARAG